VKFAVIWTTEPPCEPGLYFVRRTMESGKKVVFGGEVVGRHPFYRWIGEPLYGDALEFAGPFSVVEPSC
jgi:hypothetical protein